MEELWKKTSTSSQRQNHESFCLWQESVRALARPAKAYMIISFFDAADNNSTYCSQITRLKKKNKNHW